MWQGARVGACTGFKAVAAGPTLGYTSCRQNGRGSVCGGRVCLPGHCMGGGSHYRLTVTVTSSDTLKLHSGELDGGQTMGCAKVVWTLHTRCIVLFLLSIR